MANNEGKLERYVEARVPTSVTLGPTPMLELYGLTEAQRQALIADHARGVLDIDRKARELHVDVAQLRANLDTLAGVVRGATDSGNTATATHIQTTATTRTEVLIGNSDTARSGILSRSQTGERNWTPFYIFAAIAAVVLIAMAIGARH
jgi:hypothetical protein